MAYRGRQLFPLLSGEGKGKVKCSVGLYARRNDRFSILIYRLVYCEDSAWQSL